MKLKVGLIYGGDSFEHEVSKMTAEAIGKYIDQEKFDVEKIYIPKNGKFNVVGWPNFDVAFLAVHGPNCEDGKLQAILEEKGIKYTGSGAEASELNMDKEKMHKAFAKAGLPVVDCLSFTKWDSDAAVIEKTEREIGYPCFVKPNNAGSSVGISCAKNIHELRQGILRAFKLDQAVTIEKAVINPREIEIGILGNEDLIVSRPGEILAGGEFYSYEKKYSNPFATSTAVDNLTSEQVERIKKYAETAYRQTGCRGYARIDFLLDQEGQIFINEINTLPGFTPISMFPKLMEAAGMSYRDLITKIIELAL